MSRLVVDYWSPTSVTSTKGSSNEHSLGDISGFTDTHGPLHLVGGRSLKQSVVIFRSLDEIVLDELGEHLEARLDGQTWPYHDST